MIPRLRSLMLGCVSLLAAVPTTAEQLEVDAASLERTENLSESLANMLLELSVEMRRLDIAALSTRFPETFDATPFPTVAALPSPTKEWILEHAWTVEREPRPTTNSRFLASVSEFLLHFSSIEDVRFKVKGADFDPHAPTGKASVFFFLVGRDHQERREWVRGWIDVDAVQSDDLWRVRGWKFKSMDSMVASRDLFDDITIPAGLAEEVPRFGVPPNDGFVAHGVAIADVNEDGLVDILTSGVLGTRLFLKDPRGDGFRDVSEETLLLFGRTGSGVLFLDYDNDGDQDVFMAAIGEQILLQNQLRPTGELLFLDVSGAAGIGQPAVGFSPVAADVDSDGDTDIYVASYNRYGTVMPNAWDRATNGTPNLLFINQGDGSFREESRAWGVDDHRWSYAAAFADVDLDGRQDLYVANDFGENALFINRGDHFVDEAAERGVVDPGNGMGVSFGDHDNDGDLDLHVTNMSSTAGNRILGRLMPDATADGSVLKKLAAGNSLFENQGDGTFVNVASQAGPFGAGWAYGGGFVDFDNDGWEDLFTVNGFVSGKTMNDT